MKRDRDNPTRGCHVIWTDRSSRVWMDKYGGLVYDYEATQTEDAPRCTFTLFSEVGEPYKAGFNGFFQVYAREGFVFYGDNWPFMSDKGVPR